MKKLMAVFLTIGLVLGATTALAEVTQQDLILLSLIFRNQSGPYLEGEDPHPRVQEIASTTRGWGRSAGGDRTEAFKTLAEGLTLMTYGEWNEARQVAVLLDLRLPAKLYEAGDVVEARVFPIYEGPERFQQHYLATLTVRDAQGKTVGEGGQVHLHKPLDKVVSLALPDDLESGAYTVHYSLAAHHSHDHGPLLEAERTFFVLNGLRRRLQRLEEARNKLQEMDFDESRAHALAATTVEWHLATYRQGLEADVPGAYTDHPLFMTTVLSQGGLRVERLDFLRELDLAEELATSLEKEENPLKLRTGDMRLAYRSPVDQELVPLRIFVPEGYDPGKTYPLVVALHGAGGDENSFMDRYAGLFQANAQRRGYLAVSVNGRGPYGGYRGKSGQDVMDVLDLIQTVYSVDRRRTYLTGHSMGGGGTIAVGFDHASRFAALAPVAGFGATSQLAKAPHMPLLLAQGSADALVPVERARSFYAAAKEAGLPVKYIEKEGVDHIAIVDLVMDDIFDWFDQHAQKSR